MKKYLKLTIASLLLVVSITTSAFLLNNKDSVNSENSAYLAAGFSISVDGTINGSTFHGVASTRANNIYSLALRTEDKIEADAGKNYNISVSGCNNVKAGTASARFVTNATNTGSNVILSFEPATTNITAVNGCKITVTKKTNETSSINSTYYRISIINGEINGRKYIDRNTRGEYTITAYDGYEFNSSAKKVGCDALSLLFSVNSGSTGYVTVKNATRAVCTITLQKKTANVPSSTTNNDQSATIIVKNGAINGANSIKFSISGQTYYLGINSGYDYNNRSLSGCSKFNLEFSTSNSYRVKVNNVPNGETCTITFNKKSDSSSSITNTGNNIKDATTRTISVTNGTFAGGSSKVTTQYKSSLVVYPPNGKKFTGFSKSGAGYAVGVTLKDSGAYALVSVSSFGSIETKINFSVTNSQTAVRPNVKRWLYVYLDEKLKEVKEIGSPTITVSTTDKINKTKTINVCSGKGVTVGYGSNLKTATVQANKNNVFSKYSGAYCSVRLYTETYLKTHKVSSGSSSSGGRYTSPTTNPDVYLCEDENAEKVSLSQIGEIGGSIFGNKNYKAITIEGKKELDGSYFCVNPGTVLPKYGCMSKIPATDLLKGSVTERGRYVILTSGASESVMSDALNIYNCSKTVNQQCQTADNRSDNLKAVGNGIYEAIEEAIKSASETNPDSTEANYGVTIDIIMSALCKSSSCSINGISVDSSLVKLVAEAFLARSDEKYINVKDPYKLEYVEGSSTASGSDLIAKIRVSANAGYNVDSLRSIKFTAENKDKDAVTITNTAKDGDTIVYTVRIKGGNVSSTTLCTPLKVSANISFAGTGTDVTIIHITSNSQELYAVERGNGTTTVNAASVNIPRPNCQKPDCFNGTDSYTSLYKSGKITIDEYTTVCCTDPRAKNNMPAGVYADYCESTCDNNIEAPVCQRGGTSQSFHETGEDGITKTNWNKCIKKSGSKDINGNNYNVETIKGPQNTPYCNQYCKEDAEYIFQGFGYNPKSEYSIFAGTYFTFEDYGDHKGTELPYLYQKRTCAVDIKTNNFLNDVYGINVTDETAFKRLKDLVEASVANGGGYYGKARDNLKQYIENSKRADLLDTKLIPEQQKVYDNLPEKVYQVTGYTPCPTKENPKLQCPQRSYVDNPAKKAALDLLNQYKNELSTLRSSTIPGNESAYKAAIGNIETAIKTIDKCVNLSNEYNVWDYPTLSNFFYSEMTNAGKDVKDAVNEISLTPKTKKYSGSAKSNKFYTKSLDSGTSISKQLFTFKTTLPTGITKDSNTVSLMNGQKALTNSQRFFEVGLSDIDVEVTYGLGTNLYSLIPTGNIITQKSNLFSTAQKLEMGFGLPVSISTRAAKYIYSFEVTNMGKGGRLSDALARAMQSTDYICYYFLSNKVICPSDSSCIKCSEGTCVDPTEDRIEMQTAEFVPFTRTVSLNNINPNNRTLGENWTNASGQAALKKIEEDGDYIYIDKEPMYSFTLDTSTIKEIRNSNATSHYEDFNLTCDQNGEKCISSFVSEYATNNVESSRENWIEFKED